jgi:hypothetical protein
VRKAWSGDISIAQNPSLGERRIEAGEGFDQLKEETNQARNDSKKNDRFRGNRVGHSPNRNGGTQIRVLPEQAIRVWKSGITSQEPSRQTGRG